MDYGFWFMVYGLWFMVYGLWLVFYWHIKGTYGLGPAYGETKIRRICCIWHRDWGDGT